MLILSFVAGVVLVSVFGIIAYYALAADKFVETEFTEVGEPKTL